MGVVMAYLCGGFIILFSGLTTIGVWFNVNRVSSLMGFGKLDGLALNSFRVMTSALFGIIAVLTAGALHFENPSLLLLPMIALPYAAGSRYLGGLIDGFAPGVFPMIWAELFLTTMAVVTYSLLS